MAKKKMSVEEILAAARKSDGGGGSASEKPPESAPEEKTPAEETSAPDASAAESKPAASKPASKPASGGSGGKMSVAEMLAAARAEKSGEKPAEKKETPKKPAAEKPAAKKPAAAEKSAAPQPAAKAGTASILQAARAADRRGPLSKSQAAEAGGVATATKPKPAAKEKLKVPPMPAKPAYAKKPAAAGKSTAGKSKDGEVDQDRRGMLAAMAVLVGSFLAVGFTAMTATFTLWTLGLARFMFPNILTEPPSQFKVGFPSDYPPDVVETKFKAQFGVWVVNAAYQGEQQIYALSTVCTHLGCTPNWLAGERKFKCPCHGSGFYIDGINFEGPAPRPLERYAIRIADDGQLEVDKSKAFQEEKGQWADASCFVPV